MSYPTSPNEKLAGLVWLPRMLDKARKMRDGTLDEAYHPNLGKGHDARCCNFLKVEYEAIRSKIADGLDDEAMAAWCFEVGRKPDDFDIEIWNAYMIKLGTLDENPGLAEFIAQRKEAYGIQDREDIRTFFQLIDKDEERLE